MSAERTPYTVIGGYLGAGKTTLLNELLAGDHGLRLAVIVNDFGDVSIDADLIETRDGDVISLANGCLCCSLSDGLANVLGELRQRADEIDHVVIEASGVSDPVKIGQYAQPFGFDLRGVIVLVDAEQVRERAANKYVGDTVLRQLAQADLLVLNKVDLVDGATLAEVRAWLDEVAPAVRRIETSHGQVPLAVSLGELEQTTTTRSEAASGGGHEHHHDRDYETSTFVSNDPVARIDLDTFLAALGPGVLRAKGFVHLAEEPGERLLVQRVGERTTVKPVGPWGEERPVTRLVVIGLPGSIDHDQLDRALRRAHTPDPQSEKESAWATS